MISRKLGMLATTGILAIFTLSNAGAAQEIAQNKNALRTFDATGKMRMLQGTAGTTLAITQSENESLADTVKRQFAPYFGIRNPFTELVVKQSHAPSANRHNIRYQQQHAGIPVLGGQLVANLKNQQLTSMSGEVSSITLTKLTPDILPAQASTIARNAVAKWYQLDSRDLVSGTPELMIYDPALIGPGDTPQALVWKINISTQQPLPVNELVLVNANSGIITLHFSQIDTALRRATYTANNTLSLPGTLVCDESDPNCAAGDTDAQYAHRYAADTYEFYLNTHGRDSIDGNGMTIISTTHYGSAQPNAYWDGTQIIYSDGFSIADDVVAHELTHGVTESTSNLFYYYQSGAINESFSDVWGEFVDLTNNSGTDSDSVRWQLGEDIPGIGTIRHMKTPTMFGDPDRMTSPNYQFDLSFSDNGGVHSNSGINNKAVTLLVDGGPFNGRGISALGITKVAKIYYAVQTNYLTSGSDYLDLYNALNQACQDLIGTDGITAHNCTQVKNATEAVEMHLSPAAGYNPEAEICPAGAVANNFLLDDFENNLSNWTSVNLFGTNTWSRIAGYATSGTTGVYAPGTETTHDVVLRWNNSISLPTSGTYYIHFKHAFDFEADTTNKYDGGVIEYSIDGGSSWIDAGTLIDSGREYNGTLNSGGTNPLAGRPAFAAYSNGYNSTRLNLNSLAGNNLRFRFRSSADDSVSSLFWIIDEFRIYSCVTNAAPTANAGIDRTVNANIPVTLNGSASSDPDGDALTYQWTQTAGTPVTLSGANTATPSFTTPTTMNTLVFRLQVTDTFGQSDTDTVTITVNGRPSADAGTDQTVNIGQAIVLNGSGIDPEGNPVTFRWTQTGGMTVSLFNPISASTSFTAPATPTTLTFQLAVTDDQNQTSTDSVTVTVRDPAAANSSGGGGCTLNPNGRFDPIWLLMLILFSFIHLQKRRAIRTHR